MEAHFMKLVTTNYCANVASKGSLEPGSECCNRGQPIFMCYSSRHVSCVAYHFVAEPLLLLDISTFQ